MIELERTFLAKFLPADLKNCESKEIIDVYIPKTKDHPKLRIRKDGDKFFITKKQPIESYDVSKLFEQIVSLNEEEFNELIKLDGKILHKVRYFYDFNGKIAEVDVFLDDLEGLVLVDFEFDSDEEKENFKIPDFCLVDITNEEFVAGGFLCGKSYRDIEKELGRFNYNKLFFLK